MAAAKLLFALACIVGASSMNIIKTTGRPTPTPQQLKYAGGISALIHFGMSTYFHDGDPGCDAQNWNGCDPRGGCKSSQVSSFHPVNYSMTNWIQSFKDLGATSAVLTAKHGCGFLLWDTKTTLPNGQPYPYHVPDQYPVLKDFVSNCTASGIGYGFYYSLTNNFFLNAADHYVRPPSTLLPGQASINQAQYEDIQIAQMTELWTEFGGLTEIWLDGGPGPIADRVAALLNATLARDAVAFNGGGVSEHAVRWCGTEGGNPQGYPNIWSTANCGWCPSGSGAGCLPNATNAIWYPSGVDVTLQLGDHWFYTPGDGIHSLSDLQDFYHKSVGANGHLEIDFAIDRTGRVDPTHAQRYKEFGDWIRSCYGSPLGRAELKKGQTNVTLTFAGPTKMDRVMLEEDLVDGHIVAAYHVDVQIGGAWVLFSAGQPIGTKRIDLGHVYTVTAVRLVVTDAFDMYPHAFISAFAPC